MHLTSWQEQFYRLNLNKEACPLINIVRVECVKERRTRLSLNRKYTLVTQQNVDKYKNKVFNKVFGHSYYFVVH